MLEMVYDLKAIADNQVQPCFEILSRLRVDQTCLDLYLIITVFLTWKRKVEYVVFVQTNRKELNVPLK